MAGSSAAQHECHILTTSRGPPRRLTFRYIWTADLQSHHIIYRDGSSGHADKPQDLTQLRDQYNDSRHESCSTEQTTRGPLQPHPHKQDRQHHGNALQLHNLPDLSIRIIVTSPKQVSRRLEPDRD